MESKIKVMFETSYSKPDTDFGILLLLKSIEEFIAYIYVRFIHREFCYVSQINVMENKPTPLASHGARTPYRSSLYCNVPSSF